MSNARIAGSVLALAAAGPGLGYAVDQLSNLTHETAQVQKVDDCTAAMGKIGVGGAASLDAASTFWEMCGGSFGADFAPYTVAGRNLDSSKTITLDITPSEFRHIEMPKAVLADAEQHKANSEADGVIAGAMGFLAVLICGRERAHSQPRLQYPVPSHR
jgi:hypothetical protein